MVGINFHDCDRNGWRPRQRPSPPPPPPPPRPPRGPRPGVIRVGEEEYETGGFNKRRRKSRRKTTKRRTKRKH